MANKEPNNTKRRGSGQGSLIQRGGKGAVYIALYYDATGKRREKSTRTTCKATAQRILASLLEDVALRRAGLIDATDEAISVAETKPIAGHLDDYRRCLLGKRTAKHAKETHNLAARVVESGKIKRLSALTPDRVERALGTITDKGDGWGGSVRTYNKALTAIRSFSRWLSDNDRTRHHKLRRLKTRVGDEAKDKRHDRRVFSLEESTRLIAEAEHYAAPFGRTPATNSSGRRYVLVSGEDRGMAYRLALGTGYRAGELISLTPASFHLNRTDPIVVVEEAYTKNGLLGEQPIPSDLVPVLRRWLADKPAGVPVFNFTSKNSARMIRRDMAEARARWIGEADTDTGRKARQRSAFLRDIDDAGKRLDFHALRHTCGTRLGLMPGATTAQVRKAMRHGSSRMTDRYMRPGLSDTAALVNSLPVEGQHRPAPDAVRATGTDGAVGRIDPADGQHGGGGRGDGARLQISGAKTHTGEKPHSTPTQNPSSKGANQRQTAHRGATSASATRADMRDTVKSGGITKPLVFQWLTPPTNSDCASDDVSPILSDAPAVCPSGLRERIANPLSLLNVGSNPTTAFSFQTQTDGSCPEIPEVQPPQTRPNDPIRRHFMPEQPFDSQPVPAEPAKRLDLRDIKSPKRLDFRAIRLIYGHQEAQKNQEGASRK